MLKYFAKYLTFIMLFCSPVLTSAQTIDVTSSACYIMDTSIEDINVAKARASLEAKRMAAEKAKVYIESRSQVENMVLTSDEIICVAAGLIIVTEEKYFIEPSGKEMLVKCELRAIVDADKIDLRKILDDRLALDAYIELEKKYNGLKSENEALLAQIKGSKGENSYSDRNALLNNAKYVQSIQLIMSGLALERRNSLIEAIEKYNQAEQITPEYSVIYYNRGNLYYKLKIIDKAISDYLKAIEYKSDDSAAYYNLGNIYRENQKFDEALSCYSNAIKYNPNYDKAYCNRALTYVMLKQYAKALSDCNKAITLNEDFWGSYTIRGHISLLLGNYEGALEDSTKALALNSNAAVALRINGFANEYLGNLDKALDSYNKFLSIFPNDAAMIDNINRVKNSKRQ